MARPTLRRMWLLQLLLALLWAASALRVDPNVRTRWRPAPAGLQPTTPTLRTATSLDAADGATDPAVALGMGAAKAAKEEAKEERRRLRKARRAMKKAQVEAMESRRKFVRGLRKRAKLRLRGWRKAKKIRNLRNWPVQRAAVSVSSRLAFMKTPRGPRRLLRRLRRRAALDQDDFGVVLVVGATGRVGCRIVEQLRSRGIPVRALVRNREKALQVLNDGQKLKRGSGLDIATGDITMPGSLTRAAFADVAAIVCCTGSIVEPAPRSEEQAAVSSNLDSADFFVPRVVGEPKINDYEGVCNLLGAALQWAALVDKPLFDTARASPERWSEEWRTLDDRFASGVCKSQFELVPGKGETGDIPAAVFSGSVQRSEDTADARGSGAGAFASVRTRPFAATLDLSRYTGLALRVKTDGQRYKVIVRDVASWAGVGWVGFINTPAGEWADVRIPWAEFRPLLRGTTVKHGSALSTHRIVGLQFMLSEYDFDGLINPTLRDGNFELCVTSIGGYYEQQNSTTTSAKTASVARAVAASFGLPSNETALVEGTPTFVYISSAGVTRPGKPGLDLDQEPPAVRMSDMLGGLLTWKLRAEERIRKSGLPYAIVRPCALTMEDGGAPLLLEQGDTAKGKVAREDVAELCVAALGSSDATGKTFEVRSDVDLFKKFRRTEPLPPREFVSMFSELATDDAPGQPPVPGQVAPPPTPSALEPVR